MGVSRRKFLGQGASVAATAGILGASAAGAVEKAGEQEPKKRARAMVGACGLSCKACPLMKAKKCKGCASGKEASAEMLKKKPCPVLRCAAKKKIDYCGTGCKMFTKCPKVVGKPYAESFLAMIEKRLNPKS